MPASQDSRQPFCNDGTVVVLFAVRFFFALFTMLAIGAAKIKIRKSLTVACKLHP